MNKKVLITGVSGMDGSNLVDYLLKNTDHVIYGMVRRLSVKNHGNIAHLADEPRFRLISGDLTDGMSIDNAVSSILPDYFINLAAQSFVAESFNTPVNTVMTDGMGVLYCLEAIRKHAPSCRFYSAGSSEEFGDVLYSPQDINHPIRPRSPYGASKAFARHITKVYRESYNLYALHSILFNHEGVRRGEEFVTRKITKGISRILRVLGTGRPFPPIELGNLDAKRDWSDSEDFVEGIWRMLNQEEYREELKNLKYSQGGILLPFAIEQRNSSVLSKYIKEYVLSSGQTHSVREFVEKAFRYAGIVGEWKGEGENEVFMASHYKLEIEESPQTQTRALTFEYSLKDNCGPLVKINPKFYRPADVELLWGDSTPARQELGWAPKTSFDQLVEKMVKADIN